MPSRKQSRKKRLVRLARNDTPRETSTGNSRPSTMVILYFSLIALIWFGRVPPSLFNAIRMVSTNSSGGSFMETTNTSAQTETEIQPESESKDKDTGNDIVVMIRTYAGDRWRAGGLIIPTLKMFINPLVIDKMFVLDDESELDHAWGKCLQDDDPDLSIKYEAQPSNWEEMFHGTAFLRLGRQQYNKPGYDRQQWSTFYLDRIAEPSHEIIAVIDADGCFFSYMTRETILSDDGRIKLRAGKQKSHYAMDTKALNMPTPYEFMYPNRMPITFWKSTFANVRAHIETEWGKPFDEAFTEFSRGRYSQFNIMAHYAVAMEPDRYVLIASDDANGTVSIGSNMCRPHDVNRGCCATFDKDCRETPADITNSVNKYDTYATFWETHQNVSDLHYANVKRDVMVLEQKDPQRYESMAQACQNWREGGRNVVLQCTGNDTELMAYVTPLSS